MNSVNLKCILNHSIRQTMHQDHQKHQHILKPCPYLFVMFEDVIITHINYLILMNIYKGIMKIIMKKS